VTSRACVRLLLAAAAVAACTKAPPVKNAAPAATAPSPRGVSLADFEKPPDDSPERANLANLAYGASIVSRTAEATLDASAAQLIDGDPASAWLSPGHDPEQSIVVALPSRSRIEQLGARRPASARAGVREVLVERSLDGVQFEPFTTLQLAASSDYQIATVPPAEAAYLRITTAQPTGSFAQLNSFVARGKAVEPLAPRTLDGCWSVNRITGASFEQHGNSVSGTIGDLSLEGGTDGRAFHFVWTRGPQYGMAIVTLTPDSKRLTGIRWYEEAYPLFLGGSWFGERTPCTAHVLPGKAAPREDVFQLFLKRFGRFPLYGLAFDGQAKLLPGSTPELERLARHLAANPRTLWNVTGHGDPRRLASVREALLQQGLDLKNVVFVQAKTTRRETFTEPMRVLYGNIDLEIRR
jgi:hypothetical protein